MYEEQVARGAALLDERKPGWHRQINLERLDMANPCLCVLGQVFAEAARHGQDGYEAGYISLWRKDIPNYGGGLAAEHGFTLDFDLDTSLTVTRRLRWIGLQVAWIAEIRKRDAADKEQTDGIRIS